MRMDMTTSLDAIDLKILRLLQEDARLTTKELAGRVNLSTTPVFERLKRLEREGFIKKYVAVLDAEKLDLGFEVFCSVKLKQMTRDVARAFTSSARLMPALISAPFSDISCVRAWRTSSFSSWVKYRSLETSVCLRI